jgi:hypothetical protein
MNSFSSSPTTAEITIRLAYADDELALIRLAALDSVPAVPPAPRLLAEIDGEPRAAVSLRDGSAVADPFTPTAEVLELLHRRAAHLLGVTRRRRSRGSWAPTRRRVQARRS